MSGWTEDGLACAWRALMRQDAEEDWRFVHLTTIGPVSVEAGCHFPVGREALIVSFREYIRSILPDCPKAKASTFPALRGRLSSPVERP